MSDYECSCSHPCECALYLTVACSFSPEFKARLVAKLGTDGLLGVPRGVSWDHKTFCLQYIDPHQQAEPKKERIGEDGENEDAYEHDNITMGRMVLIRNEREWQQCWEVALKEDDNELEVDIVELKSKDVLPDEPELPSSAATTHEDDGSNLVMQFVSNSISEGDFAHLGNTEDVNGGWTDDEDDAGDDGPGRSPDVELTNRSTLRHADLGSGRDTHDQDNIRPAENPGSRHKSDAVNRNHAGCTNEGWFGTGALPRESRPGSSQLSSARSSSIGTEQARQELLDLDASVG